MSDLILGPVASGYNLSKIDSNFSAIEAKINADVLQVSGGHNTMSQALDMNGQEIINAGPIHSSDFILNGVSITGAGGTASSAQVNSDWNAVSGITAILNKPILGTASAQATTAFATSVQGAKADSAVQPSGSITGNAATATTLATPRSIAGVPFDGSANIAIPYSGLAGQPTLGSAAATNSTAYATAAQGTLATGATQSADLISTASGKGAALVGFLQSGTGAVARTQLAKSRERLSVLDFGASPAASAAVNTAAFNACISAAVAANATVWIPGGVYTINTIFLPDNISLIGSGSQTCSLVQAASVSTGLLKTTQFDGLIASPGTGLNNLNITVQGMTLDGNQSGGTGGVTMGWGSGNPRMIDVLVRNSPNVGIYTTNSQYGGTVSGSPTAFVGIFRDVYVNAAWYEGWYHNGPSDIMTSNLWVTDCGRGADNTYAGIRIHGSAVKMTQTHVYMGSSGNRMKYSLWLEAGGNVINNSHFEGAYTPVCIQSSGNTFSPDCYYYASWGTVTAMFTGSCVSNIFKGIIAPPGATSQGANGSTTGILFTSAGTDYFAGNEIDVVMSGQKVAPINFGSKSAGGNVVRIIEGDTTPSYAAGTANPNDLVDIVYLNGSYANYSNNKPVAMVTFGLSGGVVVIKRAINVSSVSYTTTGSFNINFTRSVPLSLIATASAMPSLFAVFPYANSSSVQALFTSNGTTLTDPTEVSAVFYAP